MDLAAGAVGAVAGLLKHGKAKLVFADEKGDAGGGGLGGALLSAAASALPIPGLGPEDKDSELTFMFNPTEYRISQSVDVRRTPAKWEPGGKIEYVSTGPMTLQMQLFFDDFGSAKGDVTPKISKLLQWQLPSGSPGSRKPPPFVKFQWGNTQLDTFTGIITTVNVNYTIFRKDGTPLQAKVDLTIEGTRKIAPGKNPTSHAVDMRRVHTVVEGETLQSVAWTELGDAGLWRSIADANDIDDPLRVPPGRTLLIPSAADAARTA
jgi:hypothetical protein